METPQRKSGFYRVKRKGKWDICYFDSKEGRWQISGRLAGFLDKHAEEINETPISPDP